MDFGPRSSDAAGLSIFEGGGEDTIFAIILFDEDVIVSSSGLHW